MSRTAMYRVTKEGEVVPHKEFSNSWRGAMLVWDYMARRYLGQEVGFLLMSNMDKVWVLWKNPDIPEAHRIVMGSTFDMVIIKQENIERLADAFADFCKDFSDPGHLPAQAAVLYELAGHKDCAGICWNQTTVNASPWYIYKDDEGEGRPYNINIDSDHWFLFDAFEEGEK